MDTEFLTSYESTKYGSTFVRTLDDLYFRTSVHHIILLPHIYIITLGTCKNSKTTVIRRYNIRK